MSSGARRGTPFAGGVLAGVIAPTLIASSALAGFDGFAIHSVPVGDLRGDGVLWLRHRVYASFDSADDHLYMVNGNSTHDLEIWSNGVQGFYQDTSPTAGDVEHPAGDEEHFPALAHDTFVTIGCTDADACGHTSVCPGFSFGAHALTSDNICWTRLPTPGNEQLTAAGPDGLVLLGQFTVELGAYLHGTVNLLTQEGGRQTARDGLTFTTEPEFPCPADTNLDGDVDVTDLNNIIVDWGTDGTANGGDITGALPGSLPDGIVNVSDLNAVIVSWGLCQ